MSDHLILPASMSRGQIKAKYQQLLDHLCREVQQQMPDGMSFAIVTFTRDTGHYAGYVSPSPKNIVIAGARACAADLEKKKYFEGNSRILLPN